MRDNLLSNKTCFRFYTTKNRLFFYFKYLFQSSRSNNSCGPFCGFINWWLSSYHFRKYKSDPCLGFLEIQQFFSFRQKLCYKKKVFFKPFIVNNILFRMLNESENFWNIKFQNLPLKNLQNYRKKNETQWENKLKEVEVNLNTEDKI